MVVEHGCSYKNIFQKYKERLPVTVSSGQNKAIKAKLEVRQNDYVIIKVNYHNITLNSHVILRPLCILRNRSFRAHFSLTSLPTICNSFFIDIGVFSGQSENENNNILDLHIEVVNLLILTYMKQM